MISNILLFLGFVAVVLSAFDVFNYAALDEKNPDWRGAVVKICVGFILICIGTGLKWLGL